LLLSQRFARRRLPPLPFEVNFFLFFLFFSGALGDLTDNLLGE